MFKFRDLGWYIGLMFVIAITLSGLMQWVYPGYWGPNYTQPKTTVMP